MSIQQLKNLASTNYLPNKFPHFSISCIRISIADVQIKITFKPCEKNSYPKALIKEFIISSLANFITPNSKRSPDAEITFVDLTEIVSLYKKNLSFHLVSTHITDYVVFTHYDISISQFYTILSYILIQSLQKKDGILLHASAIETPSGAIIFLGKSGAGKSTTITMLQRHFTVLADDSVIVRKKGTIWKLYQTPFYEKESWIKRTPNTHTIRAIYFIQQGKKTNIQSIKKGVIKKMLIENEALPSGQKHNSPTVLDFIRTNTFNRLIRNLNPEPLLQILSQL